MRILKVNPIEVRCMSKYCKDGHSKSILVGKCYNHQRIYSYITFPAILLESNEVLSKATLKMYCIRACGNYEGIKVSIDNDDISSKIINTGYYEWDLSGLIKADDINNINLKVYTKDDIKGCGLREFEALHVDTIPVLTLFADVISNS